MGRTRRKGKLPSHEYFGSLLKESKPDPLITFRFRETLSPLKQHKVLWAHPGRELRFPGWNYSGLTKLLREDLQGAPEPEKAWISLFWMKLKLFRDSFLEYRAYARYLWTMLQSPEGQKKYKVTMEMAPWYFNDRVPQMMRNIACRGMPVLAFLEEIPVELWVPLSFAPLFEAEDPKKMELAFEKPPSEEQQDRFRDAFRSYIRKIAPKAVFIPPEDTHVKVGSRCYNDGGTIRKDSEKPQSSYDSSFKYVLSTTGHLSARETWVPGKSIKNCNSWWTCFVDQFISGIDYSAMNQTAEVVWERIAPILARNPVLGYYDLSGFGLQYPREFLRIQVEEILSLYPNETVKEMSRILIKILDELDVEMPDGTHVQPPRGVGLGYFENLKSIGVWSVIDPDNRILSAFGDQFIIIKSLDPKGEIPLLASHEEVSEVKDFGCWDPQEALKSFGFIEQKLKDQELPIKFNWMGAQMDSSGCKVPRSIWTDISGALTKEFHWERKDALAGIHLPEQFSHIWPRLAYIYERMFGFEFLRGESMNHPENLGVNQLAPRMEGWLKDWKVSRMRRPGTEYQSSVININPFGDPVGRGDAKRFSIERKKVYRMSKPFDTAIRDYINPRVEYNSDKRPPLTALARSTPMYADIRMLALHGMTTGKVFAGLPPEEMLLAPSRQKYAYDPFAARATGGYQITTSRRAIRGPDAELEELAEYGVACLDITKGHYVLRSDQPNVGYKYAWDEASGWSNQPEPNQNPYLIGKILEALGNDQVPSRSPSPITGGDSGNGLEERAAPPVGLLLSLLSDQVLPDEHIEEVAEEEFNSFPETDDSTLLDYYRETLEDVIRAESESVGSDIGDDGIDIDNALAYLEAEGLTTEPVGGDSPQWVI